MMTRRFLLAAAAVTTAAAAIPAVPSLAVEAAAPAAAPPLPAWVVGTPDCFDWQIVRTLDPDEALRQIAISNAGGTCTGCENANCDFCCEMRNLEVLRVPHMDAIEKPTPADWIRAQCGHTCSRCSEETFADYGGHAVGDEAVCEGCMEPADWQIADPERYAEMLAEGAGA